MFWTMSGLPPPHAMLTAPHRGRGRKLDGRTSVNFKSGTDLEPHQGKVSASRFHFKKVTGGSQVLVVRRVHNLDH